MPGGEYGRNMPVADPDGYAWAVGVTLPA